MPWDLNLYWNLCLDDFCGSVNSAVGPTIFSKTQKRMFLVLSKLTLRHPSMSLSLFRQPHGIGFSWAINCKLGALILLIGAICVVVGRQWIICYYTVERFIGCGALSLELLGFRGFSHVLWLIFSLVRGIGWKSTHLTFGI